jgi:hypothetical protein
MPPKHKTIDRAVVAPPEPPCQIQPWMPVTRVVFRFCVVYFGLFALATQVSGSLFLIPTVSFRGLGPLWPMREITFWIAAHVFGVTARPVYTGVAGGETVFFWVQTAWLFVLAAIAAGIWTLLDSRRVEYTTLHRWFHLFLRLGLASQMFEYGMTKVIPVQFRAPSLNVLVTPASDLSLETVFWTTIGAAPAYQIFTGCVEVLGGILLLIPRTALLGALVSLAAVGHVFILNMTYDIGLKLISFHLVLMALVLLAPDFRRLANLFIFNRAAGPSTQAELFRSVRANRIAIAAQVLLGVYLLSVQADANWVYWYEQGAGRPKSVLYGIWNVDQIEVDGRAQPAILNDYDRRWRRVIFDAPDAMTFQRTDDSFARYGVAIDPYGRRLSLTRGGSRKWSAHFTYDKPGDDRLVLDGEMDDHKIHLQLQRADFNSFRLLNSGFRWMRPVE